MKPIEKFLYHTTAYTVTISFLFFAFAKIFKLDELSVSFSRYLLIFALSMVIAAAENIFLIEKLSVYLKRAIHYVALAVAFVTVFLTVRGADGDFEFGAAAVFAGIVIFTVCYIPITVIIHFIRKSQSERDAKKSVKPAEKKKYSPKFK